MEVNNVISMADYRNSRTANTLERQLDQLKVRGYTEVAYSIELEKIDQDINQAAHSRDEPASGLAAVGRLLDNPKGSNIV